MTEPHAAAPAPARGVLRIYLGAAPGVGKTYAMLNEGWRRKHRGTDVVVGYVETHDRAQTREQLRDLEVVPRRSIVYRDARLEEMDLDAVLARRPDVALVDEMAHTNAPGGRHEKRWQDIEELLDAGIDVITTVNVQHLESLNDVTRRITGVTQRETVPDVVARRADQIELVDMSPEALRRRMAHGNIYPAERIDAALGNYFRPGNLGALRELALLWVADRVEDSLHDYLVAHGIAEAWETRERVAVAITGAPGGDTVIRRASRLASRMKGELLGVRVVPSDGLATTPGPHLDAHRLLLGELGGTYHEAVGPDVAGTLVDFARAEKATQLVLGASRQSRLTHLVRGSVVADVIRLASDLDVHVISGIEPMPSSRRARRPPSTLSRRRRLAALICGLAGLPLLTAALAQADSLTLPTILLVFLAAVVAIAAIGGIAIGLAAAVGAFLLTNWFFVPPIHTFTIANAQNLVALVVFVAVAGTVSTLVDSAARRSREAMRARAEAEALARTTATLVGEADPLPGLVAQIRSTFELTAVAVLTAHPARSSGWDVAASAGTPVPDSPAQGEAFPLGGDDNGVEKDGRSGAQLVVVGPNLRADDRRVLRMFADQLAMALRRRALQHEASRAEALADTDELRTALLRAVSHDLRTPLASIKASVTSLLQPDIGFSEEIRRDFLTTIDTETDRLNRLVGNLLDMSRMQVGALNVLTRPTSLDEVVAAALGSLSTSTAAVCIDVPPTLPLVMTDPTLLERAIANVVANALPYSSESAPVRITAGSVGDRVHLRIADRGPGIPPDQRDSVFEPFQRLGDHPNGTGVGLGLALARGFVAAMHGELTIDDTPGGGCTVVIDLPIAEEVAS